MGARSARGGRGTVFLFKRVEQQWTLLDQRLEPDVDSTFDGNFGWDVAMDESNTIIVGAPFEDDSNGAAFIFKENGPDSWSEFDVVAGDGSDVLPVQLFGTSVTIENSIAVVGAPGTFLPALLFAGVVFLYEIPDGDEGEAIFVQRLTAAIPVSSGFYGTSVALKGGSLAVGSPGTNGDVGSAFLYFRGDGGSWGLVEQVAPLTNASIQYGSAVAVSFDALVVGAPFDEVDGVTSGSVFAYAVVGGDACPANEGNCLPGGCEGVCVGAAGTIGAGSCLANAPGDEACAFLNGIVGANSCRNSRACKEMTGEFDMSA